jgi:hypothetical protein
MLYEGGKKLSMFNGQLSYVIDGGASRNLLFTDAARRASENDIGQLTIEH